MVVPYKRDFIIVDGGHFMEYEPESGRAVVINNSLYRVLLYEREFNMLQSNARQLPLDDAEKLLGIMPQEEYFEQELKIFNFLFFYLGKFRTNLESAAYF